MGDDLEARLKSHARAFEGLMSLIPAKEYYGKDASITSTQWQKTTKQTKAEWQAAKRAKLDPASHKSAQDVLDENARKRKRELELEGDSEASSDIDMDIEKEKPLEGLKAPAKKAKKQKTAAEPDPEAETEETTEPVDKEAHEAKAKAQARADKRRQKAEKKKEKKEKNKEKQELKKAQQKEFTAGLGDTKEPKVDQEIENEEEEENEDDGPIEVEHPDERMQALDVSGLIEEPISTATPSSADSNVSAESSISATSSSSSIVPPATGEVPEKKKQKNTFKYDAEQQEAFRARLSAKLEAMRAARKADGPDGRPARNRAELIESRRKKEAERKAAKKAGRQLAKEDEARLKAEEQLARLRGGSGSPSLFPLRSSTPESERNFNFGRIAWEDGQQLDSTLSNFLQTGKKKGASDPKTALEAAKKKQNRISGLDVQKRKEIEEKELWLAAKKRAQGEKVHDDVSLIKKTLKRQEKQKAKSKEEWVERLTNVQKGKEMKQKKREENLKKRRDESKKGKGKGAKKVKKPAKKVRRPGFEGTFKAR